MFDVVYTFWLSLVHSLTDLHQQILRDRRRRIVLGLMLLLLLTAIHLGEIVAGVARRSVTQAPTEIPKQ